LRETSDLTLQDIVEHEIPPLRLELAAATDLLVARGG